jgi:hypothetical protein
MLSKMSTGPLWAAFISFLIGAYFGFIRPPISV